MPADGVGSDVSVAFVVERSCNHGVSDAGVGECCEKGGAVCVIEVVKKDADGASGSAAGGLFGGEPVS
jgi:hypothetical protein